jgi:hypothetical protein
MAAKKLRIASAFALFVGAMALTGVVAPASIAAAGDLHLAILEFHQPSDAGKDDLITAVPFNKNPGDSGLVKVQVTKEVLNTETNEIELVYPDAGEVTVRFRLATSDEGGTASSTLTVTPELNDGVGIATFDTALSIADANAALTTAYKIVPQARYTALEGSWPYEGAPSDPFDIWEDACSGTDCDVFLRNNLETYTAQGNFGLGASKFTGELVSCPDQKVIFGNTTFFHQTSGTESDVVFLVEHITREDMKAATNNGQKHIGWCVGLETPGKWNFPLQDTDGDNVKDPGEFYVGMAPKCPNKRTAAQSAPCILSQMGDNLGGSFIRGYLPGGDPPRRT